MRTIDTLPHHYINFDVKISWEISAVSGKSVISGYIQNIRYTTIEDFEIWVTVLDEHGKTVQRAVDYVISAKMGQGEPTQFSVTMPGIIHPGANLVFTYKYYGCDGGDGDKRMQSFESIAT